MQGIVFYGNFYKPIIFSGVQYIFRSFMARHRNCCYDVNKDKKYRFTVSTSFVRIRTCDTTFYCMHNIMQKMNLFVLDREK